MARQYVAKSDNPMKQDVLAWSKRVFSFPGMFFWLGFIGLPVGVGSGIILYDFDRHSLCVPTLNALLNGTIGTVVRIGLLVSFLGLCVVARTSHKFYSRLLERVSPRSEFKSTMKVILILIDVSISCHAFCLFLIASVKFDSHKVIFVFVNFLYLASGVAFHILVDMIGRKLRTYVPMSEGLTITTGALIWVCAIVFSIGASVSSLRRWMYPRAALCQYMAMALLSFKIVFVGINILGAGFLPGIAQRVQSPNRNSGEWKPMP